MLPPYKGEKRCKITINFLIVQQLGEFFVVRVFFCAVSPPVVPLFFREPMPKKAKRSHERDASLNLGYE